KENIFEEFRQILLYKVLFPPGNCLFQTVFSYKKTLPAAVIDDLELLQKIIGSHDGIRVDFQLHRKVPNRKDLLTGRPPACQDVLADQSCDLQIYRFIVLEF